jgi:hypothetical protein
LGTKFAVATDGPTAAQFDETANFKFRASTSRFPLALDDQQPLMNETAAAVVVHATVRPAKVA